MKKIIYSLIIKSWRFAPFKKQLIFILSLVPLNFDKYIRNIWFNGKFKINLLDSSFYLSSNQHDKGILEIFYKGIDKCWDANSIIIWSKLAKRSKGIFDIGANFGLYSIAAKSANPESEVYSFEPSIHAHKMLLQNTIANNYDIKIFDIALSNTNGTAVFYDSKKSSAASSLVMDKMQPSDIEAREVKTQTFIDFVKQEDISNIDLISIDVELFEPKVLEGMGDLISLHRPDFIIEVLNNEIGGGIEVFFNNKGYLFFEINERDMTIKKREHLSRSVDFSSHSFNFLICKVETATYLELENTLPNTR